LLSGVLTLPTESGGISKTDSTVVFTTSDSCRPAQDAAFAANIEIGIDDSRDIDINAVLRITTAGEGILSGVEIQQGKSATLSLDGVSIGIGEACQGTSCVRRLKEVANGAANAPQPLCHLHGSVQVDTARSDKFVSAPIKDAACHPIYAQEFVVPITSADEDGTKTTTTTTITIEPHGVIVATVQGSVSLDGVLYSAQTTLPFAEAPEQRCRVYCYPGAEDAASDADAKGCVKSCVKRVEECDCTLQKRISCGKTGSLGEDAATVKLGEGASTNEAALVQRLDSCYSCPAPCPAGLSCSYCTDGKRDCAVCSSGTFSEQGAMTCNKCPVGTASGPGSAACPTCPPGTSSQEGAAVCAKADAACSQSDGGASSPDTQAPDGTPAAAVVCQQFKQLIAVHPTEDICKTMCKNELMAF